MTKNMYFAIFLAIGIFPFNTVSASISGPVDLTVVPSSSSLNLNLTSSGDIYLDFSAAGSTFSMVDWTLNADTSIQIDGSHSLSWPYGSASTGSVGDASPVSVIGDVLIKISPDWQFSNVVMSTTENLYILDLPELAIWDNLSLNTHGNVQINSTLTADTVVLAGPTGLGGNLEISSGTGITGGSIVGGDSVLVINNDPIILGGSVTLTLTNPTSTVPLPGGLLLWLSAAGMLAWVKRDPAWTQTG